MKRLWHLLGLGTLLAAMLLTLSACGQSVAKQDVLARDEQSKQITWGLSPIPAYLA